MIARGARSELRLNADGGGYAIDTRASSDAEPGEQPEPRGVFYAASTLLMPSIGGDAA
jgi:hypothetical protein